MKNKNAVKFLTSLSGESKEQFKSRFANLKRLSGIEQTPGGNGGIITALFGRDHVSIANEADGTIRPGVEYLANESLLTQNYFDEPLTTYAVGWRDPNNIEATLDFLAPPVPVPRRFTYKSWVNVEEFLSEGANDDARAIGSEFPTVVYTGSEVHAKTVNRGLRLRVDLDEVAAPDSPLAGGIAAYQARIVEKLKRRILRNSLRRAVSGLVASATNTNKTWSSGPVDPDQDTLGIIKTATSEGGIRPNRVCWGDSAWTNRVLGHRAQNTAGGFASAGLTPDGAGSFLGVDGYVSRERYSNAGTALAEIVNNLVFLFYAVAGQDTEDPSNIKRFYSMTDSGGPWRVYVQQVSSKLVDITVEHYELISVTSVLGINTITVS
jgi:hypothetical protein